LSGRRIQMGVAGLFWLVLVLVVVKRGRALISNDGL
jgi:hypothetical protein